MLASAAVIVNVVAMPFMLVGLVPLLLIFYWLRNYYLKTAGEIKRLEATGKSFSFLLFNNLNVRVFPQKTGRCVLKIALFQAPQRKVSSSACVFKRLRFRAVHSSVFSKLYAVQRFHCEKLKVSSQTSQCVKTTNASEIDPYYITISTLLNSYARDVCGFYNSIKFLVFRIPRF